MEIIWHGHSSFSIIFSNKKILIDPFFTGNPAFGNQDKDKIISGLTHIALTHGHGDHVGDTVNIAKETEAQIIANADLCSYLKTKGLSDFNQGNTGGTIVFDDFSITFVQAHHSSASLDENGISHSLGHSNGLVFHIKGDKTVYHMGDTDIFGDMSLIEELHKPDIGLVPIGDRFTMGGAVAALSCRRFFNFNKIIPCHFGTFPIIDSSADKFIEAMEDDVSKVKVLSAGESIKL